MSNRNRKIFAGSMAAALLLGAGSLAWFTDRTEGTVTGQAGNLCIELSDIEANLDHLAPGDNEEIKFEYKNLGSLAMDTRITYALSYELDSEVEDVIENDLDKVATLTIGDEELVLTAENDKVTGTFETGVLNGTKEFSGEDSLSEALNFHFDESVGNIGQLMTFKLDVLVEGKQNRNNPTWEQVHKTEITFGGEEMQVVPKSACNVDTATQGTINLVFSDEAIKEFHDLFGDETPGMRVELIHYQSYYSDEGGMGFYAKESKEIRAEDLSTIDITEHVAEWLETGTTEDESDTPDFIGVEIVLDFENVGSLALIIDPFKVGLTSPKEAYESGESYDLVVKGDVVYVIDEEPGE